MNAVVAERGQVTIPKSLRFQLGIEPGTVLEFHEDNGRLVAIKQELRKSPVASVRGSLKSRKRTDQIIAELRGEA
jgi:AbrB family looped-hinge helix DNA binding protein